MGIFQRLDDPVGLLPARLGENPRNVPVLDWAGRRSLWAFRRAHADGHVDEKYLRFVLDSTLKVGQRNIVSTKDASRAIQVACQLCAVLSEETT